MARSRFRIVETVCTVTNWFRSRRASKTVASVLVSNFSDHISIEFYDRELGKRMGIVFDLESAEQLFDSLGRNIFQLNSKRGEA